MLRLNFVIQGHERAILKGILQVSAFTPLLPPPYHWDV